MRPRSTLLRCQETLRRRRSSDRSQIVHISQRVRGGSQRKPARHYFLPDSDVIYSFARPSRHKLIASWVANTRAKRCHRMPKSSDTSHKILEWAPAENRAGALVFGSGARWRRVARPRRCPSPWSCARRRSGPPPKFPTACRRGPSTSRGGRGRGTSGRRSTRTASWRPTRSCWSTPLARQPRLSA